MAGAVPWWAIRTRAASPSTSVAQYRPDWKADGCTISTSRPVRSGVISASCRSWLSEFCRAWRISRKIARLASVSRPHVHTSASLDVTRLESSTRVTRRRTAITRDRAVGRRNGSRRTSDAADEHESHDALLVDPGRFAVSTTLDEFGAHRSTFCPRSRAVFPLSSRPRIEFSERGVRSAPAGSQDGV